MADKENKKNKKKAQEAQEAQETQETEPQEGAEAAEQPEALQQLQEKLDAEHEAHLRLAAEYDNFRKRTAKEKEAIWNDAKADTAAAFLPVYDNLERALKQDTADEAYKKGVEMTMNQLVSVMEKLGVESFGAAGDHFDPQLHNAVMHIEDAAYGEGVVVEEFEKGFCIGDRVLRYSVVKVAN